MEEDGTGGENESGQEHYQHGNRDDLDALVRDEAEKHDDGTDKVRIVRVHGTDVVDAIVKRPVIGTQMNEPPPNVNDEHYDANDDGDFEQQGIAVGCAKLRK